ncbi:MAG TPA: GreA/GreB family elongation factor [Polyangia bacterium]
MSKAFTKEDEGGVEELPPVDSWPAGVKNYLTPAGHAALKQEIDRLREAPRADAQARLRADARLRALLPRLEAAEVIDPVVQPRDVVRFGATVDVEDEGGARRRYRIVGVDEVDARRGWVSWRSPIARALTGRRVGEAATAHTPAGDEELVVVAIDYEA